MKLFNLLAGSALGFVAKPTGDDRFCDFYTLKATAIFDNGSTEDVAAAMYPGAPSVMGTITFTQTNCRGPVQIEGTVHGLSDGKHGWHVHTLGNAQGGCGGDFTGGHWNPFQASLGAEDDGRKKREVGQIGNVECSGGSCPVNNSDHLIRLHGLRSIIGRSVVIHQNEDAGPDGGSGSRVACATIVWATDAWVEN